MRKAVIDLGTNTFNLLIADVSNGELYVLHSEKEGVALGMGGINERKITTDAMQRGIKALRKYSEICQNFRVTQINAFGTSALRDASNGDEFVQLVKNELNLDIRIISGLEEADLIYTGVKNIHSFDDKAVIVDIGGGSTEFILADKQGVQMSQSFNIGVSRIFQQFHLNDPIDAADEANIISFLDGKTDGRLAEWSCPVLIGSSGSFETFYELIYARKFPKDNRMIEIDKKDLFDVLDQLKKSTLAERDKNHFILPIRKIMAPITAVKTEWFIEKMHVERILISPYSLKEGALYKNIEE